MSRDEAELILSVYDREHVRDVVADRLLVDVLEDRHFASIDEVEQQGERMSGERFE